MIGRNVSGVRNAAVRQQAPSRTAPPIPCALDLLTIIAFTAEMRFLIPVYGCGSAGYHADRTAIVNNRS